MIQVEVARISQPAVNRGRALPICLIILCQSFQTVSSAGIALLLPSIRNDLALSFTQGGTLAAANIFSYALMQIPAGYLADRYGVEKTFIIGSFGTTLFCLTFGLVADHGYAILNQTLAGIFHAFLFQSGLALQASLFGAERRATAMGLSMVAIILGQLLINSLGPSLSEHFSWRFPFIFFGFAGMLSSLAYLWYGHAFAHAESSLKLSFIDAFRLFQHPFMWVYGMIQCIRLGIMQGISFWLPSLLIDEKSLPLAATGLILALRALLIAPSTMLGSYLSDRLRKPTAIMEVSLVILAITTAALVTVGHRGLLIALIFINAIFIQFYFGPLFALPVERYGIRMMATLGGFGNFFANLGAFSFTYLLGALKDHTGYFRSGFYAITGACLVGLVLTLVLEEMRRRP